MDISEEHVQSIKQVEKLIQKSPVYQEEHIDYIIYARLDGFIVDIFDTHSRAETVCVHYDMLDNCESGWEMLIHKLQGALLKFMH